MIRRWSPLLTTKSKELGKNTTKRDLTLFSGAAEGLVGSETPSSREHLVSLLSVEQLLSDRE